MIFDNGRQGGGRRAERSLFGCIYLGHEGVGPLDGFV